MKKLLLLIMLAGLGNAAHAYDGYGKKQPYAIAIHASSPIGLMTKYGGGLEIRMRSVSVQADYYKYNGIYPGKQIYGELDFFIPSRNQNEFYLYGKGMFGDASYNGNSLSFMGYNTDITFPSSDYYGGGVGVGRRFNFHHFFVTLSGGFKYCGFTNTMPTAEKNMYSVFYYTGPGAFADLHLQFGLQF